MPDPDPSLLDYYNQEKPPRMEPPYWLPFLFAILQFIWCLPAEFYQEAALGDGLAKQPVRDLFIYLATIVPSAIAMVVGIWRCALRYRLDDHTFRNCKLSVFSMVVAASFIAFAIWWWVYDDIIHGNSTHGLW
jgi:hypothetical protein